MHIELSRKEIVASLLTSLGTGLRMPLTFIDAHHYIQHSQHIGKGLRGFKLYLKQFSEKLTVKLVRLMEDGDYVFAHAEYHFSASVAAGFNIFRFQDDRIVEHWDNLQLLPAHHPISSLTAGSVTIQERNRTAANKQLARYTVEDILLNGDNSRCPYYFRDNVQFQHYTCRHTNSTGNDSNIKYNKIHRVLGEGNFVLVVSEGRRADTHTAFYDLFRLENGRVAEHWNTAEKILTNDHTNSNTKF
ncbi:nuclear transport factor 2 family protein [Chitinophaga agri]|uniref:SnoaL-like domain-containing protein n=1 Tax=Chitinophaga agri TaxID=2703787 RepID=A0A6B9Z9D1_9BACT|nr:nuclear transport factor 2 family protein [Chitinophaga agri]QHS58882.1 hypothetical protein GWR21_04470 [Chitinophaga agri]